MQIGKIKKGFTLSEVLVTLAILGVIAAATIPILITATNNAASVDGLKRADLMLKTATSTLMANNGGTMNYLVAANDYNSEMNKYCTVLNCINKCNIGTSGCFNTQAYTKTLYGGSFPDTISSYSSAILSNGMTMYFAASSCTSATYCGYIVIDVNGFKPPNILGRDIFEFQVAPNGIFAIGSMNSTNGYNNTNWTTYCNPSSSNSSSGIGCAGRVLIQNVMSY